ncbi:MAG TPA: response regulator transcription factor [Myxococcota bacterium]|jgi:DNA-binding NarL/FixJ family response regulator
MKDRLELRGAYMKSTIILVEDHEVLRDGIRSLISATDDFEIVAEAADGATAVELVERHRPDLVVMDIWLPRLSGIEATRKIAQMEGTRVLILSQHDSWSYVEEALKAGAAGYLVKTSSGFQLLTALRAVREGKSFLSPEIAGRVVDAVVRPDRNASSAIGALSGREREVLQLIGEGLSSKEIAESLGVSARTVEAHRANVMEKLGIHKVAGLVRFAIREGIIGP